MSIRRTVIFKEGWEDQIIEDLNEVEKRARARLIDKQKHTWQLQAKLCLKTDIRLQKRL